MKKLAGLALFMLVLYVALLTADKGARSVVSHQNLAQRAGLYGVITLGAGILIISGGIDLSIGSVVGLSATSLAVLLVDYQMQPALALALVVLLGIAIGTINGLLVTYLRLQPFVVTLCGLFLYRGMARVVAGDQTKGLAGGFQGLKYYLAQSRDLLGVPSAMWIFLILAAIAAVFLHLSIHGRYLYAIGSNERAARYSGIRVNFYKVLAYALCSMAAALCGIMSLMDQNMSQPSATGGFFELYAIAGAVLGGCSLRGGEGSVLGIAIGTLSLVMLPSLTVMWGVQSAYESVVIGAALLFGAILDELTRRRGSAK